MNELCGRGKYKFSTNLDNFLYKEFMEITFDFETQSTKSNWKLLDEGKKMYQNIISFVQLLSPFY